MKKLSNSEISTKLKDYSEWELDEESGKLTSGFEFEDFQQAMDFANVIGRVAEEINHHPDIIIHDYKYVTLFTSTHAVKGISEKDFDLIRTIETEVNS